MALGCVRLLLWGPDRRVLSEGRSSGAGAEESLGEGSWELTSRLDYSCSTDHSERKSLSWNMTFSAGTGSGGGLVLRVLGSWLDLGCG